MAFMVWSLSASAVSTVSILTFWILAVLNFVYCSISQQCYVWTLLPLPVLLFLRGASPFLFSNSVVAVQTLSHVQLFMTPGTEARQASLSFTISQRLHKTHVHWVGNTIQPSYSLSPPSPPAFSLSQHQGLSQSVSSSHQVAKVLELPFPHQSFQWIIRTDFL